MVGLDSNVAGVGLAAVILLASGMCRHMLVMQRYAAGSTRFIEARLASRAATGLSTALCAISADARLTSRAGHYLHHNPVRTLP